MNSLTEKMSIVNTAQLASPGIRIILKTKEGKELYLARDDLVLIKSLHRMVKDLGIDNHEVTVPVDLSISSEQLDRIVDWCRRSRIEGANQLVKKIFPLDVHHLLHYIEIAQFLDINLLVENLSEMAAVQLNKMSVEEAKKALGRENTIPCTPEQLKTIKKFKKLFNNYSDDI